MATTNATPTCRKYFLSIVTPVLLMGFLTDQASKSWASFQAVEPRILVPGYLAAYSVPNPGMILGHGRDQAHTSSVFAFLGIACACLIGRKAFADPGRWPSANCLACGLLLAGIFGNTVDRLALGHVRDFLVTWVIPTIVFNVADLLVVVGCASLILVRACGGWCSRRYLRPTALAAA